jgi:hypothetical protein
MYWSGGPIRGDERVFSNIVQVRPTQVLLLSDRRT